jgi:hypothetical protein
VGNDDRVPLLRQRADLLLQFLDPLVAQRGRFDDG